jgi:hypothetical protein
MNHVLSAIRFAMRLFAKNPLFAIVAVATLSLSIVGQGVRPFRPRVGGIMAT